MSDWPAAGDDSLYRMDRLCDVFEDAWQAGQRPRVVEFLAGVEGSMRATLLRELLRLLAHYLREDQRRRWQQGEQVRLRQYLDETPQLHEEPELVFGLICDEVLLREELSDTPPRPEDYLDLLPSHEVQLRHFFADRRARHQATHNVSSGKGTLQRPSRPETLAGAGRPGEPAAPPLDRYQPGGFIGRGGMGDVFWVHDPHLGRDLAVKVLREDRRQPHLVRRFLEEARLHSQLQHPSVAPVHELGEALDGRPFFTMKLVKGRTLDQLLRDRAGPAEDLPRFLGIFEQTCQGVAYAHAQGVIHRDLKPHNVMVGAFGEVQVMDWGLAKVLCRVLEGTPAAGQETLAPTALGDTVDDVDGTQPGQVMGTPSYMAPEQARGKVEQVDERADVFGLGAMLCEILTGTPPFTGENISAILARAQVCDHTEALDRLDACGVDAELLHLAKACLAAERDERPRNAGLVAEEVKAYLAGVQERLQAAERERAAAQARAEESKKTAAAEQARAEEERKTAAAERQARRRLVGAALVVLATMATAFPIVMHSRNKAITLADEKGKLADEKGKLLEETTQLAIDKDNLAKEKEEEAHKAQREATRLAFQQATTLLDRGDVGRGMHQLAQTLDLATRARVPDLEQASRTQLALWRSRTTALKMLLPHPEEVLAVAFSADGRTIATGGADRAARLWDAKTGKPLGDPLRPEGQVVQPVFGPDFSSSRPRFPSAGFGPDQPKFAGEFVAMAVSPDGRILAAATGDPYYRGRSGLVDHFGLSLSRRRSPLRTPSISPFASKMDFSDRADSMRTPPVIWELASRKPLLSTTSSDPIWAVAFSPDGRTLLTGGGHYQKRSPGDITDFTGLGLGRRPGMKRPAAGGTARFWDVSKGEPLPRRLPHDNAVLAVAFSPDGQRVLTGSADQTARLWDAATGKPLGNPLDHDGLVVAVAFSPDGQTFLTCSQTSRNQSKLQLWNAATRQPLAQPLSHPRLVQAAAYSPDGRKILTGSVDALTNKGEADLWDVATGKPLGQPLPHPGAVHAVAWSPDGRWILTGCADKIARLWDAIPHSAILQLGHHENVISYSPDGRLVLLGTPSADGQHCEQASLGEIRSDKPKHRLPLDGELTGTAAFSPDAHKMLFGVRREKGRTEETLYLVDTAGRRLIGTPLQPPGSLEAVAISPDGRTVLTGNNPGSAKEGEASLWDIATGKILHKLEHDAPVLSVTFSPDSQTIATGSGMPSTKKGEARLYDAVSGQLLKTLPHDGPVRVVLFSPDGRTLATSSDDGTVHLWAVPSGEPYPAVFSHNGAVRALAFRADGRALLTGSDDQMARLWDVVSGKSLGEVLMHRGPVRAVAISDDGHFLATGSDDRTAQVWEAATGRPLGESLAHEGPVVSVTFGGDGRTLLTRAARTNTTVRRRVGDVWETSVGRRWDSIGRVWEIPAPVEGDPRSVLLWTQVLTGSEMEADGSLRPLDAETWRKLHERLGQRDDSSPTSESLLAWHRREARVAETAGQWFATAWHLQRLSDSEPASEFLHFRRGRAYALSRQSQKAVTELTKAISAGDSGSEVHHLRGLAHSALKQNDEAIADFSKAIDGVRAFRKEHDSWMIRFHRAQVYYHLRQMDKVIADLSQVLTVKSDHGPSWHGRAMAYAELGKLERASSDLTTALQKPDAPATTWCDLALLRLKQGDAKGYQQVCTGALGHLEQTEDPALAARLAWTCSLAPASTSDPEQIVAVAWRAFSDKPNQAISRFELYRLWERSVHAGAGDDLKSYIGRRALSAALYRAGAFKEAIECATYAIKLRKEPAPSVWLILALAHQRDGKADEAKAWLDKARTWIAQARKDGSAWDRLPWTERLPLELLQPEAEKLLAENDPGPEKSGR